VSTNKKYNFIKDSENPNRNQTTDQRQECPISQEAVGL
jgi:hypothetical protein